jgi:hypothetical protein
MKSDGIILPDSAVRKQTLHFRDSEDLVILAKGDSFHDGLAIAREKGCECWVLNEMTRTPEVTMVFEMHDFDERIRKSNPVHLETSGVPIMMNDMYLDVPNCIKYPMNAILDDFEIPYFNNTVCLMIAFALHTKRFKNIYVFGVDYRGAERAEQEFERPCTEFWLGVAMGRGCNLYTSKQTNMFTYTGYLKGIIYGFTKNYEQPFVDFKKQMPHLWAEYILAEYGGRALTKEVYDHDDWMESLAKHATCYVHEKLVETQRLKAAEDKFKDTLKDNQGY